MSLDLFIVFVGYLNEDVWASVWEKDKGKMNSNYFFLHIAVVWFIIENN